MKYEFVYLERPECTSYTVLNDASRSVSYGRGKYYCDKQDSSYLSPDWAGPAWYRFTMPAGTHIPESSPGQYHCGTQATGWLSGVHPTSPGASNNNAKFCFHWGSNDCAKSTQGKVTNCGSYFVYYLENATGCADRYCATN